MLLRYAVAETSDMEARKEKIFSVDGETRRRESSAKWAEGAHLKQHVSQSCP